MAPAMRGHALLPSGSISTFPSFPMSNHSHPPEGRSLVFKIYFIFNYIFYVYQRILLLTMDSPKKPTNLVKMSHLKPSDSEHLQYSD